MKDPLNRQPARWMMQLIHLPGNAWGGEANNIADPSLTLFLRALSVDLLVNMFDNRTLNIL